LLGQCCTRDGQIVGKKYYPQYVYSYSTANVQVDCIVDVDGVNVVFVMQKKETDKGDSIGANTFSCKINGEVFIAKVSVDTRQNPKSKGFELPKDIEIIDMSK
jgi:hypothetical protein